MRTAAPGASPTPPPSGWEPTRGSIGIPFALGLLVGGAIGCGVLFLVPGDISGSAPNAALLAPGAPSPRSFVEARTSASGAAAREARTGVAAIDLWVSRAERGGIPFPLRISGAEDVGKLAVTLRDVPQTAWLSAGERWDAHTWRLGMDDLAQLRLSIGEGAPQTFQMRIEVTSGAGRTIATSTARVRMRDEDGAAVGRHAPRGDAPALAVKPLNEGLSQGLFPGQTAKPTLSLAQITGGAEASLQPRPDGLLALGGPVDGAPAAFPVMRQVWWKMPNADWTPFSLGGSAH